MKRFPEDGFVFVRGDELLLNNPGMAAFTVGADCYVDIEAKTNEEVTEKDGMVFGIATTS